MTKKPYTPRDRDNRSHTKGQNDGRKNSYDRPYKHDIFESNERFREVERMNRPYDRGWQDGYKNRFK